MVEENQGLPRFLTACDFGEIRGSASNHQSSDAGEAGSLECGR